MGKQPTAVKVAKIITMGGNWKMVLFLVIAGIVVLVVVAVWLINILNTVLPVIAGLAIALGLGWLIYKVSMSNPQQQIPQQPSQGPDEDIVAQCQSMYSSPSDISQCIKHEGRL